LTGADDYSAALCDMYVDGAQDLIPKMHPAIGAFFAGDKAKVVGLKSTHTPSVIHMFCRRKNWITS
jgi:hypothetical protein